MLRRLPVPRERLLPNGRVDVLRQVGLFGGAYLLYRLVEGAVVNNGAVAYTHATDVISFERALHVFVEPNVQAWAMGSHLLIEVATYIYINAQTTILIGLLAYLYLVHNRSYYFVRNMLFAAMAIGLIGYAFFPTMPPRLLPNWGFVDTTSYITGGANTSPVSMAFFNPYAAVPSMHVAFAVMLGWPLARLARSYVVRAWWIFWPVLITFVTVITANHFFLDAVLGLATAGVAAIVARRLARVRPHVWAFADPSAARVAGS
ncbi:MAG: phosphatase PAP2 family protein [Solirubrobacteraceae bacterium]|jgi:hypothetical protein